MTVQQRKLLRWTENDFSFMMSINSQMLLFRIFSFIYCAPQIIRTCKEWILPAIYFVGQNN